MKIKELLNKLNEIVNENQQMLEANVIMQIDAEHLMSVSIDDINIEGDVVTLEGEW